MRKLAIFSFSFAAALAIYVYLLPAAIGLTVGAVLLLAGAVLCFFRTTAVKRVRIAVFGLAIGLAWGCFYEHLRITPLLSLCGRQEITAQVCRSADETELGCAVEAEVNGGKILLYLNTQPDALSLGDTVTVAADITDVLHGEKVENRLNYQSRDITLIGVQKGDLRIEAVQRVPVKYWPQYAAAAVTEKIREIFADDTQGFISGLLMGEKEDLSYQLRNQMSITGISHIIAVSGMHVSVILTALQVFTNRRKALLAAVSIPFIWLFAAVVGFTPSVTRAAIMHTFLLMAPVFHRESDIPTALGSALLFILIENPWAIANVSLQLSFTAILGILCCSERLYQWQIQCFAPKEEKKAKQWKKTTQFRILSSGAIVIAATLGAQVFTTPLVALYFGQVSVISPVTNVLLMQIISLCFILTFPILLIGFIYPAAGAVLSWPISLLVRLVLRVVSFLSKIPNAAVYTSSIYIVVWLVILYGAIGVFLLCKRRRPLLLISGILVCLVGALMLSSWDPSVLRVKVLDVGQGQCIVMRSGDMTAMVDCGGDEGDYSGEYAARALLSEGILSVDVLVLTHYDDDHVCGLEQFLSRVRVKQILAPAYYADKEKRSAVLGIAERYGVPVESVAYDMDIPFSNGQLRILAPMGIQADNVGLCALMSVQDYDILITGDMHSSGEARLLKTRSLPDIEVLVAGHHGSKHSTSEALLQATKPETVLISVGENHYGHPTREVLERIAAIGATVYRTDLDGDITISR